MLQTPSGCSLPSLFKSLIQISPASPRASSDRSPPIAVAGQSILHNEFNELFGKLHIVFEMHVRDLRLDHPNLGEVPTRRRFLRAKGRAETIHFTEGQCLRFLVKLAVLRQIRLLAEIIDFKKCAGAFRSRRREHRCVDECKASAI